MGSGPVEGPVVPNPTSVTRRRLRQVVLVSVAAVAVCLVGVGVGRRAATNRDAQATLEEYAGQSAFVEVADRVVVESVIARGDVDPVASTSVAISPDLSAGAPVVTDLPLDVGDPIELGGVLIEVSEVPVFAMRGDVPMFRSILLGTNGVDVLQLEQSLDALGFEPNVDETWDLVDAVAMLRFREERVGAVTAATTEPSAPGNDVVEQLERQLGEARDALEQAEVPLSGAALAQAELNVDLAMDALERATRAAEVVRADDTSVVAAAAEALSAANDAARSALERHEQALAGTHPDTGVAPTPSERVRLMVELDAARADRKAALAELEAAEATAVGNEAANALAVRQAEVALLAAKEALDPVPANQLARLRQQVADLEEEIADASRLRNANRIERLSEVTPAEITFVSELPAVIDSIAVGLGASVPVGPLIAVRGASLKVETVVSARDAATIDVGANAQIVGELSGQDPIEIMVADVVAEPDGSVRLSLVGDDALLAPLAGRNVRLEIFIRESVPGALVVPLAAVVTEPTGGASFVLARRPGDGSPRRVEVSLGVSDGAFVVVTTQGGDGLGHGDLVEVGGNYDG